MSLLAAGFAVGRRSAETKLTKPENNGRLETPPNRVFNSASQTVIIDDASEFKTIFLLLISLLHGNLFFVLTTKSVPAMHALDGHELSLALLSYAIYFRVLLSHVFAALKYNARWHLRPFDFMIVFMTVTFEFVVFARDDIPWVSGENLKILLVCFAIFGSVSYSITYLRTRSGMHEAGLNREGKLQSVNVSMLLATAFLYLMDFLWVANLNVEIAINYVVSGGLWTIVYLTIRWSKLPNLSLRESPNSC